MKLLDKDHVDGKFSRFLWKTYGLFYPGKSTCCPAGVRPDQHIGAGLCLFLCDTHVVPGTLVNRLPSPLHQLLHTRTIFPFLFFILFYHFWDELSLCCPRWPRTLWLNDLSAFCPGVSQSPCACHCTQTNNLSNWLTNPTTSAPVQSSWQERPTFQKIILSLLRNVWLCFHFSYLLVCKLKALFNRKSQWKWRGYHR